MKKTALTLAAFVLMLASVPVILATDPQTLEGEFIWKRSEGDISGPLRAVFEATGDRSYDVSFFFTFEEKKHVYAGTAEGSLTAGELKGRVMTDGETPRPFDFEGKFVDGEFHGTHARFRDGEQQPTGTLTLSY